MGALRGHVVDLAVAPRATVSDVAAVPIEKSRSTERLAANAVFADAQGNHASTSLFIASNLIA